MTELKPPTPHAKEIPLVSSIFLAGSIEQGKAVEWQRRVVQDLSDLDVVIYNPRRDSWDPTLDQSPSNPVFGGQVRWELEGIRRSTFVLFNFDPTTKSPVTMLELGLCLASKRNVIVCCPPDFHRYGNVVLTMEDYARTGHRRFESLVDAVAALRTLIILFDRRRSAGA